MVVPLLLLALLLLVKTCHHTLPVQKPLLSLKNSTGNLFPYLKPEADDIPLSEMHDSEEHSGSVSESEENTESPPDKQEIMEEHNYRETVRSVHSFMGWDHIPTFESDLSEP